VALRKARVRWRGDASEARKSNALGTRVPSSRPSHPNQAQAARYAVSDGREPLGTIEQVEGGFVATSTGGTVVGMFQNLREAARAFDGGER